MLVLDNGELIDCQPVVVGGIVEIDHAGLCASYRSVCLVVFHRHTIHKQAVKGAVAGLQRSPFRAVQLAKGVVQCLNWKCWVQLSEGVLQALFQHHLAVVGPLGVGRIGGDIGTVGNLPAEGFQPAERGVFDDRFGKGEHALMPPPRTEFSRHACIWRRRAVRSLDERGSIRIRAAQYLSVRSYGLQEVICRGST